MAGIPAGGRSPKDFSRLTIVCNRMEARLQISENISYIGLKEYSKRRSFFNAINGVFFLLWLIEYRVRQSVESASY